MKLTNLLTILSISLLSACTSCPWTKEPNYMPCFKTVATVPVTNNKTGEVKQYPTMTCLDVATNKVIMSILLDPTSK